MASFLELQRVHGIWSAFVDAFMRPFGGPRLASSMPVQRIACRRFWRKSCFGVDLEVILEHFRRPFRQSWSGQRHLSGFWPPRGRSAARLFVRSMETVGNGRKRRATQVKAEAKVYLTD